MHEDCIFSVHSLAQRLCWKWDRLTENRLGKAVRFQADEEKNK